MQIKLSERLLTIAEHVEKDEVAADIGTDHGYIPIWLMTNFKCKNVILSDVNEGPLKKAVENIKKYFPENSFDLRLGNGMEILNPGEADTVIIAGMGGLLIKQILSKEPKKTALLKKMILQPRNNSAELRRFLKNLSNFTITDEQVVKEIDKFCEIITVKNNKAVTPKDFERIEKASELAKKTGLPEFIYDEFPEIYMTGTDKILAEYIAHKINIEKRIINSIGGNGKSEKSAARFNETKLRLKAFYKIQEVLC